MVFATGHRCLHLQRPTVDVRVARLATRPPDMSENAPALDLYLVKQCPDEDVVLKALRSHTDPLSLSDAAALAGLSVMAHHAQVLFEGLLPRFTQPRDRGYLLGASLLCSDGIWLRTNEVGMGWLGRLEQEHPQWTSDLLAPQEDGLSGWDRLLWALFGASCQGKEQWDDHALLACLAVILEQRHAEQFEQPHPAMPSVSRAQVWAWLWAAIPCRMSRLPHWGYLLASGIDPDFAMPVAGGQMSLGTALLWSANPDVPLPAPMGWGEQPYTWPANPSDAWFVSKTPTQSFTGQMTWHALAMLRQAGMDPAKLVEPTAWETPALGLLARLGQTGQWTIKYLNSIRNSWLDLGLDFGHATSEGRTLLDILATEHAPTLDEPLHMSALPHWRIPAAHWAAAATSPALARFWDSPAALRLLDECPRLVHALLNRLYTDFDTWETQAPPSDALGDLAFTIPDFDQACPMSPLEERIQQHIQSADLRSLIRYVLRSAITGIKTSTQLSDPKFTEQRARLLLLPARLARQTPVSPALREKLALAIIDWADDQANKQQVVVERAAPEKALTDAEHQAHRDAIAIAAAKEEDPEDDRPIMLLYSESSLKEFDTWSQGRGDDELVRSWRSRLVSTLSKGAGALELDNPVLRRHRTRRLARAETALAAIADLRSAFPHFEDVITQISDHLMLAARGDGAFSLPPLLMAGPPGTGKTFFFQELSARVRTSYKTWPMESITAGFSIVGMDTGWSNAAPGLVFEAMLADSATANPIVLLDEIDKVTTVSNAPVGPVLLGLLEPHSARRFADRCLPLMMDVSRINWVATANNLDLVDLPLRSRFNIVHVANPDYHARRAMSQHIYAALRKSHSWGASFDERLPEETLQVLARPANAARDLRKNITGALASAARGQRAQLQPADIPNQPTLPPLSPWDAPLPEPASLSAGARA